MPTLVQRYVIRVVFDLSVDLYVVRIPAFPIFVTSRFGEAILRVVSGVFAEGALTTSAISLLTSTARS
jgi:hypothetical protein